MIDMHEQILQLKPEVQFINIIKSNLASEGYCLSPVEKVAKGNFEIKEQSENAIGFVDEECVYLMPSQAYRLVKDQIGFSEYGIYQALKSEGYTVCDDRRQSTQVRITIKGNGRVSVLKFRKSLWENL